MTCIVGLVDKEGHVHIGADSAGVRGLDIRERVDPKVFKVGKFIIGCTTSFRMIQILRFHFTPPKKNKGQDIYEYMCTDFVRAVRKAFEENGFKKNRTDGEDMGGCFLVGYKSRLFLIDSDFQVGESSPAFESIGCGEAYALGSLHATQGYGDAKKRVLMALSAAAEFSGGVLPPFRLISYEK